MSYIINNSRGNIIAVVPDGTVNQGATSLSLIGQGVTSYGTDQNENLIFLLENFAAPAAPNQPILGQLWYKSDEDALYSYSTANTWQRIASESYVQAQKISPVFSGVPEAPTAPVGTANTQIATTAFVTNSPQFLGVPTAPTASVATANTQIATTAFVKNVANALGTMSQQNANSVAISGGTIINLSAPIPLASGGTGASDAANARLNLSAAKSGNNSDITSITGLTTPLSTLYGGTGSSGLTPNAVIIGNASSTVKSVSPGNVGNVLMSTGTEWVSQVFPDAGGTVTSIGLLAGSGINLSGTNPITTDGTITITNAGIIRIQGPNAAVQASGVTFVGNGVSQVGNVFTFSAVGERGPIGPQGPKGDTGPQGPQGPKGDPGQTYFLPTASSSELGGVRIDNSTIKIGDQARIYVPTATSSIRGVVRPDNLTITVTEAGYIQVPTATNSVMGVVKPDGGSITVSNGVLSSTAAGAYSPLTTSDWTSGVPSTIAAALNQLAARITAKGA